MPRAMATRVWMEIHRSGWFARLWKVCDNGPFSVARARPMAAIRGPVSASESAITRTSDPSVTMIHACAAPDRHHHIDASDDCRQHGGEPDLTYAFKDTHPGTNLLEGHGAPYLPKAGPLQAKRHEKSQRAYDV